MKYDQVITLFEQTGLSPEKIATRLGLGSMTLRRWHEHPEKDVPKSYQILIIESVYQLLIEGYLDVESKEVNAILHYATNSSFQATLKQLGVSSDDVQQPMGHHQESVLIALSKIGMNTQYQKKVEKGKLKLEPFKKIGEEWKKRVQTLQLVLDSKKIRLMDKVIAYGSLFYLIMAIDLIPDYIPVVGLIDDFGMLGFAVTFYNSRFESAVN